jgi:hypothetical protein
LCGAATAVHQFRMCLELMVTIRRNDWCLWTGEA